MKRFKNITTVVCVTVLALGLAGCKEDVPVSEPISTDTYPVATFTTDFSGSEVTEGDTVTHTITLDRMLEHDVSFEIEVSDGTAGASDYTASAVTIPAFTDSATFTMVFIDDGVPEEDETLSFELGDFDNATKFTLNPDTEYPSYDLTIKNKNSTAGLTVAYGWTNPDDDLDVFISRYDATGDSLVNYAYAASSDNPEIFIQPSTGTAGDYYYSIDAYLVHQSDVNYTLSVGFPDQSVEIFEGVLETDNMAQYTLDDFAAFGYPAILARLLEVNLSASGEFTVEHLN